MTTHCGYVAILGAPNAGKSTLLNRLVGSKIAIVTPKVQTTRTRLRGVAMEGAAQLIFVDTPGIFDAKRKFEQTLVDEAWAGASEADALLLLIDATKGLDEEAQAIIAKLAKVKKPVSLALNKIDKVQKPYLLKLATACAGLMDFAHVFMISAEKGSGVDDVSKWLAKQMPEGPWLYPEDQLTDASMRDIAAEITREKLFIMLRQELPYSLTVETEKWEEKEKGAIRVSQAISVERENQKQIVIGAKGATLKKVGTSARIELEALTGRKVHLELFVRVDEKWKEKRK